jgi:hypothetical protein
MDCDALDSTGLDGAGLREALCQLGLGSPRPVLVLVGGAANILPVVSDALGRLFDGLAPLLDGLGVTLVDGGTAFGVMAAMGEARRRSGAAFPLLGVAACGTVDPATLPLHARTCLLSDEKSMTTARCDKGARLDPNHTHFLLVPGDRWGDEVPWMSDAAGSLAAGLPSVTLVAAGGEITRLDVLTGLRSGRPLIVLAGSGGTADRLADWWRHGGTCTELPLRESERALVQIVELADAADQLPPLLRQILSP